MKIVTDTSPSHRRDHEDRFFSCMRWPLSLKQKIILTILWWPHILKLIYIVYPKNTMKNDLLLLSLAKAKKEKKYSALKPQGNELLSTVSSTWNSGDLSWEVRFLSWEDPLEKEMATHFSILAWRTPWTEAPGKLQFMRLRESGTT